MSLPILGPVLMPETTSRGRSGASPRNPSATQSEGEPSLETASRRVPGSLIAVTRSGRSRVLVCPAAVQLRLGAITHTSSTLLSALASALSPGESTPSSLVTRIMAAAEDSARYTVAFRGPIVDDLNPLISRARLNDLNPLIARAREVAERAHAPYSRFRVGAALRDA